MHLPTRVALQLLPLLLTVSAARALEAAAVINEIQYHPAAAGDPEWIELTNKLSIDVDLTGWRLTGGADYTFPVGTTLRAGGFLVVSGNPAALQTAAGITGVLGPWTGSLSNAGETIRLRDLSGRLMDEVSYNDKGRWPLAADGSGATLSRRSGHVSGSVPEGWELSRRTGGSPGASNDGIVLGPQTVLFDEVSPWLYQDTSTGLATGWQTTAYAPGTGGWLSGPGLFAFEDAALPLPAATVLVTPATHPTGTYYFQKNFPIGGNPAQTQYTLRAYVDDGAVIYLNGVEIARRGMPSTAVTATTASLTEVGNVAGYTEIPIPAGAFVAGPNTLSVEVHQAGRLLSGGSGGALTLVQTGGTAFTTNYARQAGATPFAKDLLGNGAYAPTHTIPNLTNGTYGNPSSWIGNTNNSHCGVSFGATTVNVGSVAWGRDNTGTFTDRCAGTYTLQYTTVPNPNGTTPDASWITIGTVNYPTATSAYSVRHAYTFTPVDATGIRLIVPGNGINSGGCIDELEAGPAIPPPAPVFKLMSTGGVMDNASNMALTGTAFAKDVLPGYPDTHTISRLNDGIYGNSNSWIGNSTNSWAGISFSSLRQIGRIAWGRDNTGTYADRSEGVYTVQYTTVLNPTTATPDASWTTIGTVTVDASLGSPALRHVLEFAPVNAAGIRVIVPGSGAGSGACVDELEVYAPVAPDVVWGASLVAREIIPPPSALPLVINETGGAADAVWRVEIRNNGTTPVDVGGFVLAGSAAPAGGLTLPPQILAPGAVLVLDEVQLGFRPAVDERLFLYAPSRAGVVDCVMVKNTGRARTADGRMLTPTASTFGAENTFSFSSGVVINEIMYHFPGSSEEWIELYNSTPGPVDVSGWHLDDAVSYTLPPATVIPPGGYLVVSNNAALLQAKWPAAVITGNFTGSLNNGGDRVVLEDTVGNPVDEVTYGDGGRWPSLADGGGSSLELRDPFGDHRNPASWAASDESAKSSMQTYTYRSVANQPLGPTMWNELRLGMLDAGVCMVDDVRVTRDPDGTPQQLIQNGDFATAAAWRLLGNHGTSGVVTDGTNGSVLRLESTGPAETNHNHAETTFTGNTALVNGTTYEVSLRARWVSGSGLLGVRGYFSRIAKSFALPIPQNLGTPGAANSRAGVIGPSLSALRHSPVVPAVNQPVTVTCSAADSRPITSLTLNYGTGAAFTQVPMTASGATWSATIPGQAAGTVVQFYVSAQNASAGVSTLPAAGAASRALYIVADGQQSNVPAREIRIVMLGADSTAMFQPLNLLSNATRGGTVVVGGTDVFYDIGVRLQGSAAGRSRDGTDYQGLNVELNADQPYLGIYTSIGFDRSGRTPAVRRPDEIYAKHLFHRAGVPATRDDLAYLIGPTTTYTGHAILQLNGYNATFADDTFGREGSVFNFDGTYEPTSTTDGNVQSQKLPNPFVHHNTDMRNLGTDKEHYRGFFDIRAGKERDDYGPLMAACQAMDLTGTAFQQQTNALLDVDEWLRCTALVNLLGVGDSWFTGGFPHNARFFFPTTGKASLLPWDMDFLLSTATNASINMSTGNLNKLIAVPANNRAYLAHVRDLCMTALDPAYLNTWLTHYGTVTNHNYAASLTWLNARRTYALSLMPANVAFNITTNSGADFAVNAHTTTLTGTGWVDIRTIRRAGSAIPLTVRWTGNTAWEADVALIPGPNAITLEAVGFDGTVVSFDSITVTDNLPAPLPRDFLRITEVNYHPGAPVTPAELGVSTDDDEFEYIELQNTGTGALDLTGVRFTEGVNFTFPSGTTLAGGAHLLVVRNAAAITARYGAGLPVAGSYAPDNLNNGGETITLVDATGTVIQTFTYDDDWAPLSDGAGRALVIRDPLGATAAWQTAGGWGLSVPGGSPGAASGTALYSEFALWQHANFTALELDNPAVSGPSATPRGDGITNLTRYSLGLPPLADAAPSLPVVTTVGGNLRLTYRRLRNAPDLTCTPESTTDFTNWSELPGAVITGDNGDGTESLRVDFSGADGRKLVRVSASIP